MSELDQLCSRVRDIPDDDDLKATNEKVADTKTDTFGVSYFVPDPNDFYELADSVVGVTRDGSGHAQHFRNVFKDTAKFMRVIQVKDGIF